MTNHKIIKMHARRIADDGYYRYANFLMGMVHEQEQKNRKKRKDYEIYL